MRYLVTGGSGYIGSRLVERLSARDDTDQILIADVRPPAAFRPKTDFRRLDVRDRAATHALMAEFAPDALIHLAFLLNPIRDEDAMYDVDVNGTHNVLDAAAAAGTGHVLVTSSATAYGAFPDNPVPLTEEDPVRGVASFSYARDKTECDRLCQLWAHQHPERVMTIVRPCQVFGPSVDNYLVRLWLRQPFLADFGGVDLPVQYVHEDDVVEALTLLLDGRHAGAYNVAGDGEMRTTECAELVGMKVRRVPEKAFRRFAGLMWRLRVAEAPPGAIDFTLYPWIVSNQKLKDLGWQPRWTSRETFELTMQSKGRLEAPQGVPAPELRPPVGV